MKRNISKVVLVLAMAIAVMSIVITNNETAYADSDKVVKIHYLRDDGAYSDYTVSIWDELNQGVDYQFTVEGNEGVATYTCSSNDATVVSFLIKKNDGTTDVSKNRTIDVEELSGTLDIYVKADVEEYSTEPFSSDDTQASSDEPQVNSEEVAGEDEAADSSVESTTSIRVDDPNADYSVSTAAVVVLDIVVLVIIAGISYMVCSEKKEKNI